MVTIIKSRRKSFSMQVKGGNVIVRVPLWAKESEVGSFVDAHRDWLEEQLEKEERRQKALADIPKLTEAELRELTERARELIPQRVAYYAERIGVSYGKISIRHQKTRWGSCNARGDLSFNCLLMLTPPEVLDSVVVHELCHRREMNHSPRFYREVYRTYPDYDRWHGWLKENGTLLLQRSEK